jgi:outer membrane protein OmpA-like peptidoglycan-associated protein
VESDKATSLPVKLGLALLKDRKGEIHLDVPVTGRTDDPRFSVWKLVFQVLKNLMVKAVTSPLSLLSSMMGSDQDFSAVTFTPGSSLISQDEEQKLTALSKALLDRPALKVELKGYVDKQRDGEGYRQELLNRKLLNEKNIIAAGNKTEKTDDKQEVKKITPEEYPLLLAAIYKKEKFPKPRNALGLVKNLPPEEMKKLLIANTVIGDAELQALARERVVAVVNYLVKKGNIPVDRVFQKNDDLFKAPVKETTSRSRVELNAIAP